MNKGYAYNWTPCLARQFDWVVILVREDRGGGNSGPGGSLMVRVCACIGGLWWSWSFLNTKK